MKSYTKCTKYTKLSLIVLFVVGLFFIYSPTLLADDAQSIQQPQIKLIVNGQEVQSDIDPIIINNRTFFSIRDLGNAIGITDDNIFWTQDEQTVALTKGDKIIKVKIGSNILTLNGKSITMDVVPEIINNKIMLPPAWVARSFGFNVGWDAGNNSVMISSGNNNSSSAVTTTSISTADNQIKLVVNGQQIQLENQPMMINNNINFPIINLVKSLDITDDNIIWNAENKMLTLIKGDKVVQIQVGSKNITVNGTSFTMDVTTEIVNNVVMLPASWITRAFGYNISWDSNTRTISIIGTGNSPSALTTNSTTLHNTPNTNNNTTTNITTPSSTNTVVDTYKEQLKAKYLKELEELKIKLDNTLKEKNNRVLTKQEDGSWEFEWCVDQSAVNKAQKAYDNKYEQYQRLLN